MVHYFPLYLYLIIEREKKHLMQVYSFPQEIQWREERRKKRKIVRGKNKASEVDRAMEIT